ncbi:unnamed protein product [Heligmosomoides polygyrus]|uniref:DUF885 domain-containing protein n=1 Tax=Heligmosomoides polygyrus TaxID=6339 RepID=A0A183GSM6_HELPZ|nr:unnamed protein product [Heligmosomoides polygyrus]
MLFSSQPSPAAFEAVSAHIPGMHIMRHRFFAPTPSPSRARIAYGPSEDLVVCKVTRLQPLLALSAIVMGGFAAEGEEAIAPEAPAVTPDFLSWWDAERKDWELQPLLGDEREVDALKKLNETVTGVERKDPETVREEDYRDVFRATLNLADQLRQIPRHMEHHKSRDAVEALKAFNFWTRESFLITNTFIR